MLRVSLVYRARAIFGCLTSQVTSLFQKFPKCALFLFVFFTVRLDAHDAQGHGNHQSALDWMKTAKKIVNSTSPNGVSQHHPFFPRRMWMLRLDWLGLQWILNCLHGVCQATYEASYKRQASVGHSATAPKPCLLPLFRLEACQERKFSMLTQLTSTNGVSQHHLPPRGSWTVGGCGAVRKSNARQKIPRNENGLCE